MCGEYLTTGKRVICVVERNITSLNIRSLCPIEKRHGRAQECDGKKVKLKNGGVVRLSRGIS